MRLDLDNDTFVVAATLRNNPRGSSTSPGALTVALRGREGGNTAELGGEQANALRTSQGGADKAYALVANAIGARDYKGAGNVGWDGKVQGLEMTPGGVRRLTPLECERLMGFPDGWTDGQPDSHRYRQVGNAVVVPVAQWIGHRLVRVEELL